VVENPERLGKSGPTTWLLPGNGLPGATASQLLTGVSTYHLVTGGCTY